MNEQKQLNGSTLENVVVGESMGGLIARYALRTMEEDNEDHDTRLYVSLDSPHRGANIPLGVQYGARHIPHINVGFSTLELWEYFDNNGWGNLLAGEEFVKSNVARQMLIYQTPDNFSNQTGSSLVSSEYANFYDEYHALGDPTECYTIYSSNGSPLGTGGEQEFSPNDELLKFKFNNTFLQNLWMEQINTNANNAGAIEATVPGFWTGLVTLLGSVLVNGWVDFRVWALPNYSSSNERIYKGHLSVHVAGIVPLSYTHKVVKVKEVYPYDSAPGGQLLTCPKPLNT